MAHDTQTRTFGMLDGGMILFAATISPWLASGLCVLRLLTATKWGAGFVLAGLDSLGCEIPNDRFTRFLLPGSAHHLPQLAVMNETKRRPQLLERISHGLFVDMASDEQPVAVQSGAAVPLRERLQRLPVRVGTQDIGPWPTSRTAIPVGKDEQGQSLWLDLAADAPNAALHVGLYGQSGCGKDSLLRVWYTALCKRNTPDDIRFAIIDGKGDWLTSELTHQPHMFLAPAGGYGKAGEKRIRDTVEAIDREAERRGRIINEAGWRTRDEYVRHTQRPMPILVVAATDVMTNVKDEVEDLLVNLVSKARSLGIRVVVSMQTPSGKDTKWRMNLSTVIAGTLQAGSQDTPALGIETKDMRVRPSQLPSPQERPGVFVVKRGGEQHLVQAVYLPEDRFDAICKTFSRPKVAQKDNKTLLAGLLNGDENGHETLAKSNPVSKVSQPVSQISRHQEAEKENFEISLDDRETAKILSMILRNEKQTTIVKAMPGYRGDRHEIFVAKYKELKALTMNEQSVDDEPDIGPFGKLFM